MSVEGALYLGQQSCPWREHILTKCSRNVVGDIRTIVFFKFLLKDSQIVLFIEQEPTLQVAKPSIHCVVVAATLEDGQVGISECIVLYFSREERIRQQPLSHDKRSRRDWGSRSVVLSILTRTYLEYLPTTIRKISTIREI